MPKLRVVDGPEKGASFDIAGEAVVIGRSSEQIPLTDGNASRTHAQVHSVNNQWILTDLNSSNGTFLNGSRLLAPTALSAGDYIKIGSTLLVFDAPLPAGQRIEDRPTDIIEEVIDDGILDGSAIVASMDASDGTVELVPPDDPGVATAWRLTYSIAEILGSVDSEAVLLDRVADITFEHLIADRLVLLTSEPDSGKLTPRAVRRRADDAGDTIPAVSRTIIQHVLKTVDGVLCINAMTDDRFGGRSPQDSLFRWGQRSVICVPIACRGDVFGVLHLDCATQQHTYTSEQLRLVVAIGRLTGMALENASLVRSRVQTERLAAVGETAAYLSHHLRNILQGLHTGTEAVDLGLHRADLEAIRSGWRLMRRNLDRILHLATNLLTFSKNRRPRAELVQLNAIVEDVMEMSQGRAAERQVSLHTELNDLPPITLDPDGMLQALHNIVLNAIDAAPEQVGRVVISTRLNEIDREIVLSVADNGPGVPPASRARIFAPFQSEKGLGGTGLGLAAANKIVRELGGRIRLENGNEGGAVFHVELPCPPVHSSSRT